MTKRPDDVTWAEVAIYLAALVSFLVLAVLWAFTK